MAKMQTRELESLLGQLQNNAVGSFNASIGNERAQLMRRYLGHPYGDEVDGRSKVVDTSIRDTIESIKPELMDIFFGGDSVVEFVPRGEEDVDAAKQETDVCNWLFQQANDGFMTYYTWFTDALFQKTGYIKRYWDEQKRVEIEEYDELTPEEASVLLQELQETSDEVEILQRSGGIEVDEETGAETVEPMYLKVRRTNTDKRYAIVNVPPEEVLVHPQWTRVDFKGCPFVAHRRSATVSELLQMGFDRKDVEDLPSYDKKLETEEANVRFSEIDYHETDLNTHDESMREVMIYENYVLVDYDGDGVAEYLRVYTGSERGKILRRNRKLAIDQVTDAPFECCTPLPIPHRHYGLSTAELIEDLQKIKTVMTRQLIDNAVASNNPDTVLDEDAMTENTQQDLSFTGIGRVIRVPGGMQSIGYLQPPQLVQQSLGAIEYVDALKENRTGVTRYNQGLDADSLNKTFGGMKTLMKASHKKILMIARIFAETGVKSLFVNMHRDLRAGPMKKISVLLNGEYVEVNPRTWRHRTDVTVSVGLGTGDRDVQLQRLSVIYTEQKEAFARGLIGYDKLYHTLSEITRLSGFQDVENFWPSPEEMEQRMAQMQAQSQQNQQADPTQMLAQVEMGKIQQRAQADQTKAQLDMMKVQLERMKIENDQLKTLMQDDRERDLAAAKIEADEAARFEERVNGQDLVGGYEGG